jgi:hypothetical protein
MVDFMKRILFALILFHLGQPAGSAAEPRDAGTESDNVKAQFAKIKNAASKRNKEAVSSLFVAVDREALQGDLGMLATLKFVEVKAKPPLAVALVTGPGDTPSCDDLWFVFRDQKWMACLSMKDAAFAGNQPAQNALFQWFVERKAVLASKPKKAPQ